MRLHADVAEIILEDNIQKVNIRLKDPKTMCLLACLNFHPYPRVTFTTASRNLNNCRLYRCFVAPVAFVSVEVSGLSVFPIVVWQPNFLVRSVSVERKILLIRLCLSRANGNRRSMAIVTRECNEQNKQSKQTFTFLSCADDKEPPVSISCTLSHCCLCIVFILLCCATAATVSPLQHFVEAQTQSNSTAVLLKISSYQKSSIRKFQFILLAVSIVEASLVLRSTHRSSSNERLSTFRFGSANAEKWSPGRAFIHLASSAVPRRHGHAAPQAPGTAVGARDSHANSSPEPTLRAAARERFAKAGMPSGRRRLPAYRDICRARPSHPSVSLCPPSRAIARPLVLNTRPLTNPTSGPVVSAAAICTLA